MRRKQACRSKRVERLYVEATRRTNPWRSSSSERSPGGAWQATAAWAHDRRVLLRLIQRGRPNRNAYVESFNGRLRDECLDEHWFTHLPRRAAPPEDDHGVSFLRGELAVQKGSPLAGAISFSLPADPPDSGAAGCNHFVNSRCLAIRASRRRFAARLNSGVRRLRQACIAH